MPRNITLAKMTGNRCGIILSAKDNSKRVLDIVEANIIRDGQYELIARSPVEDISEEFGRINLSEFSSLENVLYKKASQIAQDWGRLYCVPLIDSIREQKLNRRGLLYKCLSIINSRKN